MVNGSITSEDIIGGTVSVLISLIPLLIFYLNYRADKKQINKKILELENMIYKKENEKLKREINLKEEIITRKNLENEKLKKTVQKLEEENKELKRNRK